MIIDSPKNGTVIKSKLCILGTGLGGSTLIKDLIDNGFYDFIVIETGSFKNEGSVGISEVGSDFKLPVTRGLRVGGTSNLWGTVCAPFDRSDFSEREWLTDSKWPIGLEELDMHYKRASDILGLYDSSLFNLGAVDDRFKDDLTKLNLNSDLHKKKIFQYKQPSFSYSDTIQSIFNNKNTVLKDAKLVTNSTALYFDYSDEGVAKSLVCGVADGKIIINSEIFVVSLGALETPRFLMNSNLKNESLYGNKGNQIGKNLIDHPMGNFVQVKFKKPINAPIYHRLRFPNNNRIKVGLTVDSNSQKKYNIGNNCCYLIPSFSRGIDNRSEKVKRSLIALKGKKPSLIDIFTLLRNPSVVHQIYSYMYGNKSEYNFADLWCVTEQTPSGINKIDLSNVKDKWGLNISRVNWTITSTDVDRMNNYYDYLTELFPKSDYEFIYSKDDLCWDVRSSSAAHHMGTARMSNNEKSGVVNCSNKVFGVENVYVSDASIIPVGGNANPGLTVMALSLRLSDHLLNKLNIKSI